MDDKNVVRFTPDPDIGLTDEQVRKRIDDGDYNKASSLKTKSFPAILRDNVCTLFNLINVLLAIAVLLVGSYKNMLFMLIIVINALIGTVQEIRAKKTIDKLSIVNEEKIKAIRNGKNVDIGINDIVLDDIFCLSQGQQVPTDCIVVEGSCEANESLLTGESDAVFKEIGDTLISGSFIVSGKCTVKADKVGEENYASKVFSGAKYVKKIDSKIMKSLNFIIKTMSIVIVPVGLLLFWRQFMATNYTDLQEAVVSTVAALVGMIPEGLILLTSTVLAVGVIRLSKQKVLVQEMYCIETLARVDVLCLDKTGTITEGCMVVESTHTVEGINTSQLDNILNAIAKYTPDSNPTINAVKDKYIGETTLKANHCVAFSSDKKWSGINFGADGSYVMGAEEFLFNGKNSKIQQLAKNVPVGYRVLTLAHSDNDFNGRELPYNLQPIGVIVFKDKIRKEAKATLEYFDKQGVDLKVISGDNVDTVSAIAKEAGLKNSDKVVDASTLKTDEDIYNAVEKYSVFGRVTPKQKLQMVQAIKSHGHTVAMTGDGVNDVLALKEADCSIAMASGSEAARCVSQLVLLDSNFASMPKVVAEGRRSINNIQRSASLFLVKTIFSTLLAVIFVFYGASYPFQPIQMTLISAFCIGFPSFVLALEPNENRIKGNFLQNILMRAIPGGVTVALSVVMVTVVGSIFNLPDMFISTLAVAVTSVVGLTVIFKTSYPFNPIRSIMFAICIAGVGLGITCSKWLCETKLHIENLFGFIDMNMEFALYFAICSVVALAIFISCDRLFHIMTKSNSKIMQKLNKR
ncbi:MAG: cation-translocating P-type ATPase [Acutalibacteraceae bacterium]|nr:cation-translocating P-type ATPase [Acutalibacteraceae bacterium]